MVMGEVDIGIRLDLLLTIIQVILVDHWFYSYGHDRIGNRSHTRQISSYNHGGI